MESEFINVNKGEKRKITIFTAIFLIAFGILFYNNTYFVALTPCIYPITKKRYKRKKEMEVKKNLRNQFRDLLFSFSTSFSMGFHMKEAMIEGHSQLIKTYGTDTVLSNELSKMIKKMEDTGERDVDLWNDFANRSGLEEISSFAAVYSCCRETGGDLPMAVNRAASLITEKMAVENQIRKIKGKRRVEAKIIGLMPVIILIFMRITSPEYMAVMYHNSLGIIVMTLAVLGILGAVVMGERITSIEI